MTCFADSSPQALRSIKRSRKYSGPEKVIKVAIAHKLLRQALAVGKSQQPFDEKKALAA